MSENKRKRAVNQEKSKKRYKADLHLHGETDTRTFIAIDHLFSPTAPIQRIIKDGSRIFSTTVHGPGVFVTCVKGKERQAGREIREVFESLAEQLWPASATTLADAKTDERRKESPPQANFANDGDSDDDDEGEDDLEARILKSRAKLIADRENEKMNENKVRSRLSIKANQKKGLSDPKRLTEREGRDGSDIEDEESGESGAEGTSDVRPKSKKRIVIHYTDTPCLLFVGCLSPLDPVRLTLAYLDKVKASGVSTTHAVQRLEPVSKTCVAALPELLILGEEILAQGFNNDEKKSYTFKVIAKVRNNSKLTSTNIIGELPKKVPSGHSVSLTNPELVILVTVFKSIAGISVLPRYTELRKYNVTQLVEAKDLETGQGAESRMKLSSSSAGAAPPAPPV